MRYKFIILVFKLLDRLIGKELVDKAVYNYFRDLFTDYLADYSREYIESNSSDNWNVH